MIKNAKFSECGKYRFWLIRTWKPQEHDEHILMLIGLNPSTANAKSDDPTIRSIIRLAKENGYHGIVMTNLFPFITPYSRDLAMDIDPVHMELNDRCLQANAAHCDVCFCWGNFSRIEDRAKTIIAMFPEALCFGKNKNGSPKHPLYLKANTQLIKF